MFIIICLTHRCLWERATSDGAPQCTFPMDYGYQVPAEQRSNIDCTDGCTVNNILINRNAFENDCTDVQKLGTKSHLKKSLIFSLCNICLYVI